MIDETLTEMNKRWKVNNIFFPFLVSFRRSLAQLEGGVRLKSTLLVS